jgi:hypothetical protein
VLKVAPSDEVAPSANGHGAFAPACAFSHMAFDDPIVFPGQSGRSHLHTFFGNTARPASSTAGIDPGHRQLDMPGRRGQSLVVLGAGR